MNVNFKLVPEAIVIARLDSKQAVLERAADVFASAYGIDRMAALDGFEEREKLGTTGFGRGVAIPHARSRQVDRPLVALLRLEGSVDYEAADGMPVELVFAMLSPENAGVRHLHALASISRTARDDSIRQAIMDAPDPEALYSVLSSQILRDAA